MAHDSVLDRDQRLAVIKGVGRRLQIRVTREAKAMSLLDELLAISSELGMRPLMERVLSRREILGA